MKEVGQEYIVSLKMLQMGELYKLSVITAERSIGLLRIDNGSEVYPEAYNDKEPLDFKCHLFFIPKKIVSIAKEAVFGFENKERDNRSKIFERRGELGYVRFDMSCVRMSSLEAEIAAEDSKIEIVTEESATITDGVKYSLIYAEDAKKMPVRIFKLDVCAGKTHFAIGTANDSHEYKNSKQTTRGELESYMKTHDKRVLAAVNGDFFDMFGDCKPSGVCVKDGAIICGEDTDRPFFGVLSDGTPVIANFGEHPEYRQMLAEAVGGREILLRGGKLYEFSPLEPFSYIRHPRTAIGIRADGSVVVLVVDGRIPTYSGGATLVDLASLLASFGAKDGINIDGGGSSIFYTYDEKSNDYILHNFPADLHRPTEKLIRDVYNSLLLTV